MSSVFIAQGGLADADHAAHVVSAFAQSAGGDQLPAEVCATEKNRSTTVITFIPFANLFAFLRSAVDRTWRRGSSRSRGDAAPRHKVASAVLLPRFCRRT